MSGIFQLINHISCNKYEFVFILRISLENGDFFLCKMNFFEKVLIFPKMNCQKRTVFPIKY